MPSQREAQRLKKTEELVGALFPRFGVNKRREIIRLIYEISKREKIAPEEILAEVHRESFAKLKRSLLERRYPLSIGQGVTRFYLPRLQLDPESAANLTEGRFAPRKILVEEGAGGDLADRFHSSFPRAQVEMIASLKKYRRGRGSFGIAQYNRRRRTVIITREKFDFCKRCPCTPGAVSCGYHILNLGFGCLYECAYCYLQLYVNSPGLIFPANLDDYFDHFRAYRDSPAERAWRKGPYLRIGTGEFSDSLMLDDITAYSLPLIEFFRDSPATLFEFKTKSDNIENLLRIDPRGKIVIGWTLNPPKVIAENEFYTVSLSRRLRAARRCGDAGYRLAFHFDPIISYPGWERDYAGVLEELFSAVRREEIAWISLGTLRFAPALKGIIENRFPENTLLDQELIPGFDGKLRYPAPLRLKIYRTLIDLFRKHLPHPPLYLCMEDKRIWEELRLPDYFTRRS